MFYPSKLLLSSLNDYIILYYYFVPYQARYKKNGISRTFEHHGKTETYQRREIVFAFLEVGFSFFSFGAMSPARNVVVSKIYTIGKYLTNHPKTSNGLWFHCPPLLGQLIGVIMNVQAKTFLHYTGLCPSLGLLLKKGIFEGDKTFLGQRFEGIGILK